MKKLIIAFTLALASLTAIAQGTSFKYDVHTDKLTNKVTGTNYSAKDPNTGLFIYVAKNDSWFSNKVLVGLMDFEDYETANCNKRKIRILTTAGKLYEVKAKQVGELACEFELPKDVVSGTFRAELPLISAKSTIIGNFNGKNIDFNKLK
jgi:hypothetical protein